MKIIILLLNYFLFLNIANYDPFNIDIKNKTDINLTKEFIKNLMKKNDLNKNINKKTFRTYHKVSTYLYKDNDFTTGNGMNIYNIWKYLPVINIKEINPEHLKKEVKILKKLDNLSNFLILDFFNEDSRTFLPESNVYFNTVNKRSIIFDLTSKILLIILLYLLIRNKKSKNETNNFNLKKVNVLLFLQIFLIFLIFILSFQSIKIINKDKGKIKDFSIDLINNFKKFLNKCKKLSSEIDNFNLKNFNINYLSKNEKIYNYKIKNIVKDNLDFYQKIFNQTKKITWIFKNSDKFTFIPILLLFYSIIFLIVIFFPIKYKSFKYQIVLFIFSSFFLFFLIIQIGGYFSQLTLFSDVCQNIKEIKQLNYLPISKGGIMNYINCEYQDSINYQIINFIYILNASLNEYNKRLIELRSQEVFSINELLFKHIYIKKSKINDLVLNEKYEILKTMRYFVKTLIPFRNCKIFKEWINTSTTPFCWNILTNLYTVMKIYLAIIFIFILWIIIIYEGQYIIKDLKIFSILKFNKESKLRYYYKIN